MGKTILRAVTVCSVMLAVWADDRALLTEEQRRWNTPPELIPEQVVKKSGTKNGRFLSIPITANINLNTGNNVHSLNHQGNAGSASYSESNSFSQSSAQGNGAVAQSQSVSFATGSTGHSGAASSANSQHHFVNNNAHVGGPVISFGNADASSSGAVGNTQFAAASSASFSQSSTIRFPEQSRPQLIWTNVRPNHNNDGHQQSQWPKLHIDVKPHSQNLEPTLHVSTQGSSWENRSPTIRVHRWRPNYSSHYDDIPL